MEKVQEAKEILKKVRRLEIKTRRLSNHIFAGEYHSHFKGRGMAFSEVRKYQYGDEVRSIHWNVTAKLNEAHVKVFEEERELTVMLMVDVSASGLFGSNAAFKREMMTEISAVLAFSAVQNNDKVGLMLFSDQIELYVPPRKGRRHILRIIRELIEYEPKSLKTDIGMALRHLNNVLKRKSIVFVLSDFQDKNYGDALSIAARKHDITGIRLFDQAETAIPNLGLVPMKDGESGQTLLVNTSSKSVRIRLQKDFRDFADYFEDKFLKSGAGKVSCRTDQSYVNKLMAYFKPR
jgi:uncharacterized protein (DUF58 family)